MVAIARRWGTGIGLRRLSLPLPYLLLAGALLLAVAAGHEGAALPTAFGAAFGRVAGDFVLILLPSFVLAACLAQPGTRPLGGLASLAAPAAGAAMACPDTAYAALAPMAGTRRLSVALGAYAGFKLLPPAGPLIVMTGLGVESAGLLVAGLAILVPVWLAGELWARRWSGDFTAAAPSAAAPSAGLARALAPFGLLVLLLLAGMAAGPVQSDAFAFLTSPRGALLAAAVWAVIDTPAEVRKACLESALRRTAPLLVLTGIAGAFGSFASAALPSLPTTAPAGVGALLLFFAVAALFKLVQGSSMATFAAVAPVLAPLLPFAGVGPEAAVLAICLGSLVAVLPNDSLYWLVRGDAAQGLGAGRATAILAGGTVVQAGTGLAALLVLDALGVV